MTGLHTHLGNLYELLDDEAAASADPFLSAMRALPVRTLQPRPGAVPTLHCVHASVLGCSSCR